MLGPRLLAAIALGATACSFQPAARTPGGGERPSVYISHSHEDAVRRRFAADAHCPETKVVVEEMSGGAFRAEGCGRNDFYRCKGMGEPTCSAHGAP